MPETNGTPMHTETKTYAPRKCATHDGLFIPSTGSQRQCPECKAAKPARRRQPPKRIGNGKLRRAVVPPPRRAATNGAASSAPTPAAAPRPLRPEQIATATELLEMAGYTVRTIRTPSGELLMVN